MIGALEFPTGATTTAACVGAAIANASAIARTDFIAIMIPSSACDHDRRLAKPVEADPQAILVHCFLRCDSRRPPTCGNLNDFLFRLRGWRHWRNPRRRLANIAARFVSKRRGQFQRFRFLSCLLGFSIRPTLRVVRPAAAPIGSGLAADRTFAPPAIRSCRDACAAWFQRSAMFEIVANSDGLNPNNRCYLIFGLVRLAATAGRVGAATSRHLAMGID